MILAELNNKMINQQSDLPKQPFLIGMKLQQQLLVKKQSKLKVGQEILLIVKMKIIPKEEINSSKIQKVK